MNDADLRAAFEDLLGHYQPALRRLAWAYVRDGSDDLFQEIAMALWTALPRFRGDSSERTWVYRIAHNTSISFVARGRRRAQREVVEDAPLEPAASSNAEADLIEGERRARMWEAVRQLPILDRQIISMHLEGLSAVDVSAVTGVSSVAIATRLTRIRQRLANEIRGKGGD